MAQSIKSAFADKKDARQSHKRFICKTKSQNTGAKPRYALGIYICNFDNRIMDDLAV